ncbi:hypothetical protein BGX38DRAFT_457281 [Terfezia claveryi]|nr:hypothetical protein BGX38DRAFT_457281 [Terfezia claveryi]
MDDNDITIIVGMEAQGAGKAMGENARRTVGNNDRTQLHTLNPHSPNPHSPNPHYTPKEATGSGASPNDAKEESKRTKELMLQAGGFAESPSPPKKLSLKAASQAVYCVSNHIAKATFRSPSTSEQGSGEANSMSTGILPHATSRSNPLMLHLPVRSFMSTGSSSASRANTPTFLSASTPCIPTAASLSTPSIAAASTPAVSLTPTLGIARTRTPASASALSLFRSLKSALKGKGKAKDRRRTLSFSAELAGGTSTTSLPPAATPTATTSSHKYSTIHLPLSTFFHGFRNGYKPVRSPSDGILRMLPAPVIQTHQPSLSPPLYLRRHQQ